MKQGITFKTGFRFNRNLDTIEKIEFKLKQGNHVREVNYPSDEAG